MTAVAVAIAWLATAAVETERAPRTELNFIPVVGGDSDVGVGVGGAGDLARLRPGYPPFAWRLEGAGVITFKAQEGSGRLEIPFQDYYLLLAIPRLGAQGRLRLEVRPSFTDEASQRFYGLGNASPPPPAELPRADSRYARRHAHLAVAARWALSDRLYLRPQIDLGHSAVTARPSSLLARQREEAVPEVRRLLDGPLEMTTAALEARLEYDGRDSEIVTRTGSYHHLGVRYLPPLAGGYHFAQLNVTLRHYRSAGAWTFCARAVGDAIFGDAPFYELTRIDESSVVGGGKGIRGVPGQRYYGKAKVFANLEARTELWRFSIGRKPFALSPALFADGGRVWADYGGHSGLDGTGLGLKYGLGGGLRLQQGTTFVVRADVAWSPDAEPVGAYFNAGQLF